MGKTAFEEENIPTASFVLKLTFRDNAACKCKYNIVFYFDYTATDHKGKP